MQEVAWEQQGHQERPQAFRCQQCPILKLTVFKDLSAEELENLDQVKIIQQFKSHQTLFCQDTPATGFLCIKKGAVKIYKVDDAGYERIVRIAGPGDIMGYRALLANEFYTATSEAIEDTTVCFLSREGFFNLLANNLRISLQVFSLLSKDLRQAEEALTSIVHKKVPARLAGLLLFLKDKFGTEKGDQGEFDLMITRREMAGMIGTTPETVIRLLSQFKRKGIIVHKHGQRVCLAKISALKKIANGE